MTAIAAAALLVGCGGDRGGEPRDAGPTVFAVEDSDASVTLCEQCIGRCAGPGSEPFCEPLPSYPDADCSVCRPTCFEARRPGTARLLGAPFCGMDGPDDCPGVSGLRCVEDYP